jgi:hypothetical protein
MRFFAFPRLQRCGFARHGGFHTAVAFRPQVFPTSRRFAPRSALRACFIPLARLGFPLQGFPLPGSRTSSRRPLPSCRLPPVPLSPKGATSRRVGFRALLPLEVRCSTGWRVTRRELGALLGFHLSRVLSPSAVVGASAVLPSRAWATHVTRRAFACSAGYFRTEDPTCLSRDSRPS